MSCIQQHLSNMFKLIYHKSYVNDLSEREANDQSRITARWENTLTSKLTHLNSLYQI